MAHHQEAHSLHAQFAGVLDVLFRYIRFSAVRGDTDYPRAGIVGGLEVVHGADAG
ncbi:hypothetical protein D3C85_1894850 [compost metagenome]